MTFQPACALAHLGDGSATRVVLDDVPVCLVRAGDDVYAISDVCSHADVSLSEGDVDGRTIECWLHGSRFDLATGRPTGLPATHPVPVYPVRLEGDTVLVDVTKDAL